ncbi:MAG: hypothetical protein NVSMB46_02690 [Candidatus Saccharimonadales bacterium]
MLHLSKSLINRPVLSLRTGAPVATTTEPIINPNNLKIEGFYCVDRFSKERPILLFQEIRDIIAQGIVVNDHDALSDPDELVRLKEIMDLKFELMGKQVVTVSKEKVGKVNDYAADSATLYIQKIYVGQSLFKSLSGGQLSIDRNNIIEITNRKIVIQDLLRPVKGAMPASLPAN